MLGDEMMQKLLEAAMGGDGWGGIDNAGAFAKQLNERQAAEDEERRRREAAIVQAALGTPEGQRFLVWLLGKTLGRPPGDAEIAQATTAEAYAIAKARREGQNGVVFMLIEAMGVTTKKARTKRKGRRAQPETQAEDEA